jgi:hypothetical protein
VAAAHQFIHRIRADKSGAPRHQVAHSGAPLRKLSGPQLNLPPPGARDLSMPAFPYETEGVTLLVSAPIFLYSSL